MKLSLKLEEKQILSQQMRLSMHVLQMTSPELEQYLSELSLENPLLEVRPSRYRSEAGEFARFRSRARERDPEDDEPASPGDYLAPVHRRETLAGSLREQSAALSAPEEVLRALDYLIDELDERGYLPQDALPEGAPRAACLSALELLQSLEPAGVGARSLGECLALQLRRAGVEDPLPYAICEGYLDRLARGQFNHIMRDLGISRQRLDEARELIASLEPRPSNGFDTDADIQYVFPDVEISVEDGRLSVALAERYMPLCGVDAYYASMASREGLDTETRAYFSEKLRQARWVSDCVTRRRDMLLSCAQLIAETQSAFFLGESPSLVPLTMTEAARRLGVHVSTVSRALRGKYLSCRQGLYPMSHFMAREVVSGGGTGGDLLAAIRALIASEPPDKPLSDQRIAEELSRSGCEVSRRTVAKYRERAMIPPASARRRA